MCFLENKSNTKINTNRLQVAAIFCIFFCLFSCSVALKQKDSYSWCEVTVESFVSLYWPEIPVTLWPSFVLISLEVIPNLLQMVAVTTTLVLSAKIATSNLHSQYSAYSPCQWPQYQSTKYLVAFSYHSVNGD